MDMREFIAAVAESKALVVNVVDVFDLEGTYVPEINDYFPDNPKLFVANKFDLFLPSVKRGKILAYVRAFFEEKGIDAADALVISARDREDIDALLAAIKSRQTGREAYFFGMTNVGKSTLINALVGRAKKTPGEITVSGYIGTTLDFIEAPLAPDLSLIDMPGIINARQATNYLDYANQKKLVSKKPIRPRVYQLDPGQTLFIAGFGFLKFISGSRSSFVVYAANALPIHRTRLENTGEFYERHRDDILKIPNPAERERLGKFARYDFTFGPEKVDITISGIGFVTLAGAGRVEVYCFEKIKVGIRKAII